MKACELIISSHLLLIWYTYIYIYTGGYSCYGAESIQTVASITSCQGSYSCANVASIIPALWLVCYADKSCYGSNITVDSTIYCWGNKACANTSMFNYFKI